MLYPLSFPGHPFIPHPSLSIQGGALIVSHHAALLLLSIGSTAISYHNHFMVLVGYKNRNYNTHLISLQLMLMSSRLRNRCHSLIASSKPIILSS
jgi:hypothetical protein